MSQDWKVYFEKISGISGDHHYFIGDPVGDFHMVGGNVVNWLHFSIFAVGFIFGCLGLVSVYLIVKAVQIIQAEQARRKQTTNTEAGILDAMADLTNVEFNLIEINERINTIYQQVELAKRRQGIIRRGPYDYPKDGKVDGEE